MEFTFDFSGVILPDSDNRISSKFQLPDTGYPAGYLIIKGL